MGQGDQYFFGQWGEGQFGQANYSAAKSGILGFTKAIALEVAKKGVTVNASASGYIGTDMVLAIKQEVRDSIVATVSVGRLGKRAIIDFVAAQNKLGELPMAESHRLIKKYPNRRLYDTKTSTYITLADVKNLVLQSEEFVVVDAKTGEDLTRSILMQIILEEESGGAPMFTSDLLAQMIRFYGHAMQGMMGKYLENNIKGFTEVQTKLQDQARAVYGDAVPSKDLWAQFLSFQGPAMQNMMGAYVEQSRNMFQKLQESMQEQSRKVFSGVPFPTFDPAAPSKSNEKK